MVKRGQTSDRRQLFRVCRIGSKYILPNQGSHCGSYPRGEFTEVGGNDGSLKIATWPNVPKAINRKLGAKDTLKLWLMVALHALLWFKYEHWSAQASGDDNMGVLTAVFRVASDLVE